MSDQNAKEPGKLAKFIATIIVILIIVGAVSIISAVVGGINSGSDVKKSTADTPAKTEKRSESSEITQHDAEVACQDEANIKLNGRNIVVISLLDYSPYFEKQDGTFDENKTPVYLLQWTGKDKDTNKKVGFSCWISGTPKNPVIQSLSADGVQLDGDINFPNYDADGKRLN